MAGKTYGLYAIVRCVVGWISLKGGTENVLGIIIVIAIVRVLYNAINIIGFATTLEFAVIGMVVLIGVDTDEVIQIVAEKRRLASIKSEISKLDSPVKAV